MEGGIDISRATSHDPIDARIGISLDVWCITKIDEDFVSEKR